MPILNGCQVEKLSEALRDSFVDDAELDAFLTQKLENRRLNSFSSSAANYEVRVFQLIRAAEARGWILQLISAARQARPANASLQELAAEVGLDSTADLTTAGLERIILESVPFVDVRTWRALLGELEDQVCRVEVPAGARSTVGTGFLVGPDLCITNFHVVQVLADQMADPRQARLRFDYKRAGDGTIVDEGLVFGLADDWLVASRPPSAADSLADEAGQLPARGELDFALLRVRDSPGEQPAGRAQGLPESSRRGWISRVSGDGAAIGDPLFVLQHPEDGPLKLAFGQSEGLNSNGTRLRHRVNTRPGSSGSPCLNARLELVALHHAGDPNFSPAHKPTHNAAVPIAAIREHLAGSGIADLLFRG
jgi:hypothetical protein